MNWSGLLKKFNRRKKPKRKPKYIYSDWSLGLRIQSAKKFNLSNTYSFHWLMEIHRHLLLPFLWRIPSPVAHARGVPVNYSHQPKNSLGKFNSKLCFYLRRFQVFVVGFGRETHRLDTLIVNLKAESNALMEGYLRFLGAVKVNTLFALHEPAFMI